MLFLTQALFSSLASKAAYLDPGSGSFLIQLLIAGLAGLGIAFASQWSKVKRWFAKRRGKTDKVDDEEDEQKPDA